MYIMSVVPLLIHPAAIYVPPWITPCHRHLALVCPIGDPHVTLRAAAMRQVIFMDKILTPLLGGRSSLAQAGVSVDIRMYVVCGRYQALGVLVRIRRVFFF